MDFPSFTKKRKIKTAPPVANLTGEAMGGAGLEMAEIEKLYSIPLSYRADLRTHSGRELTKVRLPGPYLTPTGFPHGKKIPYKEGQAVLVGYINNRPDSPIVLQTYPFSMSLLTSNAMTANVLFDKEEGSEGHSSGYRLVYDSTIQLKNPLNVKTMEMDPGAILPPNSLEPGVQGDTLKNKLDDLIEVVEDIVSFLQAATYTNGGGTTGTANNSSSLPPITSKITVLKNTLSLIKSKVIKHY